MAGKHAAVRPAHEKTALTRRKAARPNAAADAAAAGKEATGRALAGLDGAEWTVLHDVRWPGRKKAKLEHVVIGPGGVFVVDTKIWPGVVSVVDGVLRQDGRSREKAVIEAVEGAAAVQGMIPGVPTHAIIVLAQKEPAVGRVGDVILRSTGNVCEMLMRRPPVLAPMETWRVRTTLEQQLANAHGRDDARESVASPESAGHAARSSKLVRLTAALTMVAALMGGLQAGLFTHVGSMVSDLVFVSEDDPAPEPPKDRPKIKKQDKKPEKAASQRRG